MRSMIVPMLFLTLAAVPAVHAQSARVVSVEQPAPRLAPVSPPMAQVDTRAAVSRAPAPAASAAAVVRDTSARNVLAVIGGVVVVVALIALLR